MLPIQLYLDKNMGMFLIIWDKLFGTFQPELPDNQYQPLKYGLTKPLENETPTNIIFHEWSDIVKDCMRKDIGWQERWGYIFGPPGWSHDGSRKPAKNSGQKNSGRMPCSIHNRPLINRQLPTVNRQLQPFGACISFSST